MTLEKMEEIGMECLVANEGRLKVKGVRKFDRDCAKIQKEDLEDDVEISAEKLRGGIQKVLNFLIALGEFEMSEPRETIDIAGKPLKGIVRRHNLRLFLTNEYDIQAYKFRTGIACWYYPPPTNLSLSDERNA